jgi:hypothetical protein
VRTGAVVDDDVPEGDDCVPKGDEDDLVVGAAEL